MGKLIWLWLREDGAPPKVIQRGTRPPGRGRVVEVTAASADEARSVYRASFDGTDADEDPLTWARAELARRRVRGVDLETEVTRG